MTQTLANLDDIKKRNRPAEAPKAPAEAPFFLPTLPGLEPAFVPEGKAGHKVCPARCCRLFRARWCRLLKLKRSWRGRARLVHRPTCLDQRPETVLGPETRDGRPMTVDRRCTSIHLGA